jgi:hypothetical protein
VVDRDPEAPDPTSSRPGVHLRDGAVESILIVWPAVVSGGSISVFDRSCTGVLVVEDNGCDVIATVYPRICAAELVAC